MKRGEGLWYNVTECLSSRCSFDVRGRPFQQALNWSDDSVAPRAHFKTSAKRAALYLEGVQLSDEGVYRCRVDFRNSPTRNFQVNLTVIRKFHFLP